MHLLQIEHFEIDSQGALHVGNQEKQAVTIQQVRNTNSVLELKTVSVPVMIFATTAQPRVYIIYLYLLAFSREQLQDTTDYDFFVY